MNWHALSVETAISYLKTSIDSGLSQNEILQRQIHYGTNKFKEEKSFKLAYSFLSQFKNPLIYLLFIASGVAYFFDELKDSVVIFVVVLFNAIVGVYQEFKADESLKKIKNLVTSKVFVRRDNKDLLISSEQLVPGDIVYLNAGDKIPADLRIIESHSLMASEAILTGESLSVHKTTTPVEEVSLLADRACLLFSGTVLTHGRCKGVVFATGIQTEIGKIAKLTKSVKENETPLEEKVRVFSKTLLLFSLAIFFLILTLGFVQEIPYKELILVAISQVVSLVPEGLPVAMTIAAAVGVKRMAHKNAIIRRVSAVETLGSVSVICSDKTGTMTENKMSVEKVVTQDGEVLNFVDMNATSPHLKEIFEVALLCNDGVVTDHTESGDPTETALLRAGVRLGFSPSGLKSSYPRVDEIPFDPDLKFMMTEHLSGDGKFIALKGAPHVILEFSALCPEEREKMLSLANSLAEEGHRSLGFGILKGESFSLSQLELLKGGFKFLGLIGQMDPPRAGVSKAIEECRRAGIRTIMLTGDHQGTAISIARKVNLYEEGDQVMDGDEFDESHLDLKQVRIISRVRPDQKLKIVELLQQRGEVVAMTGDGVNDAPALARADVGVAMGKTGTDVAKEASKMVILDDRFETLVAAILEGRVVYKNIKKIVFLLFSTSLAELGVLIISLLLGFPAPFLAVQILWNNLVTEGVITVNLILDPAEGNELKSKPILRNEKLISHLMWKRIFIVVPTIILVSLSWFIFRLNSGVDLGVVRSETLTLLVFCEWFNVLNAKSEIKSGLSRDVFKNKWLLLGLIVGNFLHILVIFWKPLGSYFHTSPIDLKLIPVLALLASFVLIVEEIRKLRARKSLS
jgi:calcium-translocating P-type ATPase